MLILNVSQCLFTLVNQIQLKIKKKNKESFTQGYQKHEPSGYCLYLKGLDGMEVKTISL